MKPAGMKMTKKQLIPLILLLAAGLLSLLYGFYKIRTEYGTTVYAARSESFNEQFQKGSGVSVDFSHDQDLTLDALDFIFVDYGKTDNQGTLELTVVNSTTGETVGTSDIDVDTVSEWVWASFPLEKAYEYHAGDQLTATLRAGDDWDGANTLAAVEGRGGGTMALRIHSSYWDSFQKVYVVFAAALLVMVVLVYLGLYLFHTKLEYLFLISFTLMCGIFNLMIPVNLGPDENAHMNVVYELAEKLEGWESSSEATTLLYSDEFYSELDTDAPDHDYYVFYYNKLKARPTEKSTVEQDYWGSTENPKFLYGMAALGVAAGRHLGLGVAGTGTVARIFCFLPILLLLFYAIKRTPIGREIIFTMAMLATMVQESTTINADGIDIALAVCLLAVCLNLAYGKRNPDRRLDKILFYLDWGLMLGLTMVLSRCKFGACAPLCLLPLLVFAKKRKENRLLAWSALAVAAGSILFGFLPMIHGTMGAYSGTLWAAHYSVSDFIHDPKLLFVLIGNTIYQQMDYYLLSATGVYLGWNNIILPQYLSIIMILLIFAAAIPTEKEAGMISGRGKIWLALIALAGIGCAVGGMLIGWTDKGAECISGVQGRYFLPFLVPLLLAVSPVRITADENGHAKKAVVMGAVWMQILIVTALFVRT